MVNFKDSFVNAATEDDWHRELFNVMQVSLLPYKEELQQCH